MNFKLALVAAAALGVASTAQAADLAKKAPAAANYVKVCDAQGAGFFYIPGSDTCLKIGGYVRVEARFGGYDGNIAGPNGIGGHRAERGFYSRARANINFDARTATEYGLLRSYIELWATQNSGDSAPGMNLRQAFVQFAGITAGRAQSFFDFVEGSYTIGNLEADSSDRRVNQLAYTFSFGNGITATAALEDYSTDDATSSLRASGTYAGGVKYPDLLGVLAISQAWGKAQLMGALHSNYGLTKDKLGFAIGAGVEVNLPMLAAGDKVFVQGTYAKGALGYAIINNPNPFLNVNDATRTALATDFGFEAGDVKQSTAWGINWGLHHEFNKIWEANLGGSYLKYEDWRSANTRDFSQWIVGGDVRWKPVSGLYFGVALDYLSVDYKNSALKDASQVLGTFRVQRNF
jgi:hypothetical protein